MVSYEVSIGLILISILLCVGSLNFINIVLFQNFTFFAIPFFPLFLMFLISILAETNRAPFDLPEAESELVSGFNVEYASMGFALFFLGEYANMLLISSLTVTLFFGGWFSAFEIFFFIPSIIWFSLKLCLFVIFFIWARAALPRYRYDQLMRLGWKIFLPISLAWVLLTAGTLISFNWLPTAVIL